MADSSIAPWRSLYLLNLFEHYRLLSLTEQIQDLKEKKDGSLESPDSSTRNSMGHSAIYYSSASRIHFVLELVVAFKDSASIVESKMSK